MVASVSVPLAGKLSVTETVKRLLLFALAKAAAEPERVLILIPHHTLRNL